jgi:hypothetical protein
VLLMDFGTGLVRTVAAGFGYSLFWCLTAAVYLLLRQDTDQTEFDEVFVDGQTRRYQLPATEEKVEKSLSRKVEKPEEEEVEESKKEEVEKSKSEKVEKPAGEEVEK